MPKRFAHECNVKIKMTVNVKDIKKICMLFLDLTDATLEGAVDKWGLYFGRRYFKRYA